jgi:tRNA A-37 threonylcarbamoyl transferase component Bud32
MIRTMPREGRAEGERQQAAASDLRRATHALRDALGSEGDGALDDLGRRLAERLPDYRLEALIGRGGMGAVYRARHLRLRRTVAIKALLPPTEGVDRRAWTARFEREAVALARLQHPRIVTVFDFGRDEELAWIVMQHVEGANLRSLLAEGPMAEEEALDIARQLAEALQAAHDEGIVHRDVKPENVLVTERGDVALVDLGVARLEEADGRPGSRLTATGTALGSATYVAPELIEDPDGADHRVDVFSFGVVLYEMLTGRLPVGNFAPPSAVRGSDPRLDDPVLAALAPDPDDRPGSIAALARGLLPPAPAGGRAAARSAYPGDVRRAWMVVIVAAVGIASLNLGWFMPRSGNLYLGWDAGHAYLAAAAFAFPIVARAVLGLTSQAESRLDAAAGALATLVPWYPILFVGSGIRLHRGSWIAIGCGLTLLALGVLGVRGAASAPAGARRR